MSTGSTKSGKRARAKRRAAERTLSRREPEPAPAPDLPENAWRIGVIVILVVAAALRLYDLDLVPLHHDEGVNGNFLVRLVREGVYVYDPANYHGPTLYYFAALIPWIIKVLFGASARDTYGLTTFMIRLIPVLFGIGTIVLVFLLRRKFGSVATLAAGLMLAVSPGAVYLSRYFIHETLFVFFTLGIVVAAVWFYEERNPSYLIPAAASAALLFATKETAFISVGVLIIALALTVVYMRFNRKGQPRRYRELEGLRRITEPFGGTASFVTSILLAVAVFVTLWVLFYTSFFRNYKGIWDSFETFKIWSKTGSTAHVHPRYKYLEWLVYQESPLLFLGAIGAAIAVLRAKNSLALFCGLWSFGLIAAYSLIGYKTPWLVLNFVVPLALIAGYTIQEIHEIDHRQLRLVAVVLACAIGIAIYQSIDLNFIKYDNDKPKYVYVYAHTTRPMLDLVNLVEQIAQEHQGAQTGITIVSPDYWPLPWYFRDFKRVGYFGQMAASSEPIIIANENQKQLIENNFGELYRQVPSKAEGGSFELRPGVRLLLYVRRRGSV